MTRSPTIAPTSSVSSRNAPTPAAPEDDKDDLSGGAKFGISIAVLIPVVVLIYVIWKKCNSKDDGADSTPRVVIIETGLKERPFQTLEVMAPPGSLGIVLVTTANGPTVNVIKKDSLMKGKLREGDIIAKIGRVDTSAIGITTVILNATGIKERNITIKRPLKEGERLQPDTDLPSTDSISDV